MPPNERRRANSFRSKGVVVMKRLMMFPLKLAWRATGPIRRPLVREIETWLDRYLVQTTLAVSEEANITLDFAAGELARMQRQVEAMRSLVEDRGRAGCAATLWSPLPPVGKG